MPEVPTWSLLELGKAECGPAAFPILCQEPAAAHCPDGVVPAQTPVLPLGPTTTLSWNLALSFHKLSGKT